MGKFLRVYDWIIIAVIMFHALLDGNKRYCDVISIKRWINIVL